jgi:glutamate carboxypeptidase
MLKTLRELVEIESPSDDKAAVDAAVGFAAGWRRSWADESSAQTKQFGDRSRCGSAPRGVSASRCCCSATWIRCGRWGRCGLCPGASRMGDFRAGRAGHEGRRRDGAGSDARADELGINRPVTLLLNSDEEVGSPVSRPITERLALASAAVLVLEPAQGLACKTARKGSATTGCT